MQHEIGTFNMRLVVSVTIFLCLALIFLEVPAPPHIDGIIWVVSSGVVLLGVLGLKYYSTEHTEQFDFWQNKLLFMAGIYLLWFLITAAIGLLHHTPPLQVLRAIGPYILFAPLIFCAWMPKQVFRINDIVLILIAIGILQAFYHLYLYFCVGNFDREQVFGTLCGRITIIDNRASVPFCLATAILPLAYLFKTKKVWVFVGAALIAVLGLVATMTTLTRAFVFSVLTGWLVYFCMVLTYGNIILKENRSILFAKIMAFLLIVVLVLAGLYQSKVFRAMEQALIWRGGHFAQVLSPQDLAQMKAAGDIGADYSTGRVMEWEGAVNKWTEASYPGWLFGIGAGTSFKLSNGQQQTYVHNLLIYSLLYGGIIGLIIVLSFWTILFFTVLKQALQSEESLYLGFFALLASLFCYAELFAVHKLLSFNAMLFLIIACTLMLNTSTKKVLSGVQ